MRLRFRDDSVFEVLEGVVDPFRKLVAIAEAEINSGKWGAPPRGAYLGGLMHISTMHMAGPSDVALADKPKHRELTGTEGQTMEKAFNNAKNATNKAWAFINSKAAQSITWNRVYVTPDSKGKLVTQSYRQGYLFQSVHGMVRAIMEYLGHEGDSGICFELALGNNTNKVASCLPCSIFMSVCGTPATSTHLGRGDNWNFPPTFWKRAAWEGAVKEHFTTGIKILKDKGTEPNRNMARELEGINPNIIPEAFLEALTFEGPFLSKMLRALSL